MLKSSIFGDQSGLNACCEQKGEKKEAAASNPAVLPKIPSGTANNPSRGQNLSVLAPTGA